jgi:hypothetical protein
MKTIKVRCIKGFSGFFINLFALLFSGISWGHLAGWASAWNTIYIRKDKIGDTKLIAHELCHIHQMNTHGKFKFMLLYAIEQCKVGYRNNKYEVEARAARLQNFLGIYKVEGYL